MGYNKISEEYATELYKVLELSEKAGNNIFKSKVFNSINTPLYGDSIVFPDGEKGFLWISKSQQSLCIVYNGFSITMTISEICQSSSTRLVLTEKTILI